MVISGGGVSLGLLSSRMESLWKYYGVDWLGMIFAFVSTYYLGKQKKRGFLLGILGNIAWIGFGVLTGSIANVTANIIYIILNGRGFIKWKEKGFGQCPQDSQ